MAVPRWIFIAFLVSISLGLCSSYRPLADDAVHKEAQVEDKNGNFSNNDVEGAGIGTECVNEACESPYHYEPLPPNCGSCGQPIPPFEPPHGYEPQPPIEVEPCLPPLPPVIVPPVTLPPLPGIVVAPINHDCPVPEPCIECIDMQAKEQNETAVAQSLEPWTPELGSLAQEPCIECIGMQAKEQNETAIAESLEPWTPELGSLAQVP